MGAIKKNGILYGSSSNARATAYTNTTSGLSSTTVQGAIDELAEKDTTTIIAVDLTNWTEDTSSQSGTTLYKKQISVTDVYVKTPSIDIGAGTGYVLPTADEQESYNLLQYVTVDSTVPCLYLYASEVPTTAFYIRVGGVS